MDAGDWWRYGVVYQVYPRSFADSDGDGVGDLRGITGRLDHLNDGTPESLGVDVIWLSPFYRSPMVDFGYDVADHCAVDPTSGTMADFDALLAAAHERGIRVVLDLVPNHTSTEHPWFASSRSSKDSPHRDWYVWADPKPDGSPPNNWRSCFEAVGPAWTLDERTGQCYLHSFLREQADLNWRNPRVGRAVAEIMRFWLDRGVDGFRIDAAYRMARDPGLRDNPADGSARYDCDRPEVHDILRRLRRVLDGYGDKVAIGEVYLLDPADVVRYFGTAGDELHLVSNFPFLHQPWRASAFRAAVERVEALLPPGGWPDYTLSNLDHPRAVTRYGAASARVAAMMLLTLRGTPFLYYGEEIGMADGELPGDRVLDIDGRDPARTPMQWDASAFAGFSSAEPWLPVAPGYERCNVSVQSADPTSLLSLYRRLSWLRRRSPALRWGTFRPLSGDPDGVFAYFRQAADERLLVALNFSGNDARLTAGGDGELLLSTDPGRELGRVSLVNYALRGNEGVIVRVA